VLASIDVASSAQNSNSPLEHLAMTVAIPSVFDDETQKQME
jgi:hypothetical protein